MSLATIPNMPFVVDTSRWEGFQERYDRLREQPLTEENLTDWLHEWSDLNRLVEEVGAIAYIGSSLDTADEEKEKAFLNFVENMAPGYSLADQALKERLLERMTSDDMAGDDMRVPMQKMRNQAELFREANIPLFTELAKLGNEYDKATGGMKTDWEGEEKNLNQLNSLLLDRDRDVRERAWKATMDLWQGKREELNDIYRRMLERRRQIADNAGFDDYRAFAFREWNRFDYTPEDCLRFHDAIEAVIVPVAERIYESRRVKLGLDRLRPWDLAVDPSGKPSLRPYHGQDELIQGSLNIFQHVDPTLARYYATMAEENLL
ncbi:MAG TPA: M3 family metallopeptidase, partial [Promineifilum sp.]|nr:M3 family metallopeptidase [Promineifilum sp.]